MLAYDLLKTLYTKGFQHIKVPHFSLLKTFFNTLQNGGEKVEKKTKTAKNEHRNASISVLFRRIRALEACRERRQIVPSGANPRV